MVLNKYSIKSSPTIFQINSTKNIIKMMIWEKKVFCYFYHDRKGQVKNGNDDYSDYS